MDRNIKSGGNTM